MKPPVALQNMKVRDGSVVFDTPEDMHRVTALLNSVNHGAPIPDDIVNGVSIVRKHKGDKGRTWDIRAHKELFEGYISNSRQGYDTCRCPAHAGDSLDSLHIYRKSGAYICHYGCTGSEIYRAIMDMAAKTPTEASV